MAMNNISLIGFPYKKMLRRLLPPFLALFFNRLAEQRAKLMSKDLLRGKPSNEIETLSSSDISGDIIGKIVPS